MHEQLTALPHRDLAVQDLIECDGPGIFKGSYARVIPAGEDAVIKLTSCAATIAMFDQLIAAGRDAPVALPRVYEALGQMASGGKLPTGERVPYLGYRIERLNHGGADEFIAYALSLAAAEGLEDYATSEIDSRRLARLLARETHWGTAPAWTFLATLLDGCTSVAVLDDIAANNVMTRGDGSICLADPIATLG